MPDIDWINRFLQRELGRRDMAEAGAVEAASWLELACSKIQQVGQERRCESFFEQERFGVSTSI